MFAHNSEITAERCHCKNDFCLIGGLVNIISCGNRQHVMDAFEHDSYWTRERSFSIAGGFLWLFIYNFKMTHLRCGQPQGRTGDSICITVLFLYSDLFSRTHAVETARMSSQTRLDIRDPRRTHLWTWARERKMRASESRMERCCPGELKRENRSESAYCLSRREYWNMPVLRLHLFVNRCNCITELNSRTGSVSESFNIWFRNQFIDKIKEIFFSWTSQKQQGWMLVFS